mmetsp:Transcript_107152/g.301592  ORF Transcript_107152/g.301592 Transcript_107152/m.301592 type:complete len:126 (+) Transcript_107152:157-534(+)|eukprot:CAMPEP_0117545964 /NCGR_PEP_ID=MMETSP0784-20121206/46366_1 /TAXON_ID=39447 /ORGANISM="" /LENGTH=125 /DNA_ID=CAMNT_0005342827 /DNA_START=151 /DNA_END=528 /DNA_ORIENTATION=-
MTADAPVPAASDEVKLKLIFANDDSSQEITVSLGAQVNEVKKNILEKYWPSNLTAVENVERLRLFAGGKELGGKGLDDAKSLKDSKIAVTTMYATPVHVQHVTKAAETAAEKETAKPSQCFCTLL